MGFLNTLLGLKNRLVQEVDLMLTEAENSTPNLRKPMKYELDPVNLKSGDDIFVIEYQQNDKTYTDLFGNPYYECSVVSVNTILKKVKLQLKDNTEAVAEIPFHLSRFFYREDIAKLDAEHNPKGKNAHFIDEDEVIVVEEEH